MSSLLPNRPKSAQNLQFHKKRAHRRILIEILWSGSSSSVCFRMYLKYQSKNVELSTSSCQSFTQLRFHKEEQKEDFYHQTLQDESARFSLFIFYLNGGCTCTVHTHITMIFFFFFINRPTFFLLSIMFCFSCFSLYVFDVSLYFEYLFI